MNFTVKRGLKVLGKYLLLTVLAFSLEATAEEQLCPRSFLTHRTGSPSCWAEVDLPESRSLCIEHALWLRILHSEQVLPLGCGTYPGKWRVYSSLENMGAGNPGAEKQLKLRYFASGVPDFQGATPSLFNAIPRDLIKGFERFREKFSTLLSGLSSSDRFGILRSLLLGENPNSESSSFLRLLGFVHLYAASGIHLYAISQWIGWGVLLLCGLLGYSGLAGIRAAKILGVMTWSLLWALSGFRRGLLRPGIVVLARLFSEMLGFRWRVGSPLFVALIVDLLYSAFRVACGYGMSSIQGSLHYALAVGGGLMAAQLKKSDKGSIFSFKQHVLLALGSWVFTAMIGIFHESVLAPWTPILSLFTIPFIAFIVLPGALLSGIFAELHLGFSGSAGFGGYAGYGGYGGHVAEKLALGVGILTDFFISLLARATLALGGIWVVSFRSLLIAGTLAALLGIFSHSFRKQNRKLLFLGSLLLLFRLLFISKESWSKESWDFNAAHAQSFGNNLKAQVVEQLDVGQGDSAVVQYYESNSEVLRAFLVDSGSEKSLRLSDWFTLFAARNIMTLDWVVLTHLDEDHRGGLAKLSKLLPISEVVTSDQELVSERGETLKGMLKLAKVPLLGWRDTRFPFPYFNPVTLRAHHANAGNENMNGVWIPLSSGWNYLNLGDSDQDQENSSIQKVRELQSRYPGPIVLKLSHHGSQHSSSDEFLQAVSPTQSWISVGAANHYGHPGAEVLEKLRARRVPILRTDEQGSLRIRGLLNQIKGRRD